MPEEVASALHLHLLRELELACGLLRRARTQLEVGLEKCWVSWGDHGEMTSFLVDLSWGYSWDMISYNPTTCFMMFLLGYN